MNHVMFYEVKEDWFLFRVGPRSMDDGVNVSRG
jgi:hypothetical protein